MALYPCAVPRCTKQALVGPTDLYIACAACGLRFCGPHLYDPFQHKCARRPEQRQDDYIWLARLKLVSDSNLAERSVLKLVRDLLSKSKLTCPHVLQKRRPCDQVSLAQAQLSWSGIWISTCTPRMR